MSSVITAQYRRFYSLTRYRLPRGVDAKLDSVEYGLPLSETIPTI